MVPNAVQDLAFCRANRMLNDDDNSTGPVPLGFSAQFFGQWYDDVFVNNNGNVTFGAPKETATPGSMAESVVPIIAPFFGDVDTTYRGDVTYGSSGDTFCVTWTEVGYAVQHTEKTNTFQLLLTSRTDTSGREAGDFTITFNYDRVQWETGDFSDGEGGLGGLSAVVGYSAGTRVTGSHQDLAGSGVPGTFLDTGTAPLVSGGTSADQAGRYVFEVDNTGFSTPRVVTNQTPPSISDPVAGAPVRVDPGSWNRDGVTFSYQWLRDDVVIPGAAAATFTPGAGDVGSVLSVRVTAAKDGFTSGFAISASKTVVAAAGGAGGGTGGGTGGDPGGGTGGDPGGDTGGETGGEADSSITNTSRPRVTGTAKVGWSLSATPGRWDTTELSYTYQWLRNGRAIDGATDPVYRLRRADAGQRIRAEVTGHRAGYLDGTATSRRLSIAKLSSATTARPVSQRIARGEHGRLVVVVTVGERRLRHGELLVRADGRRLSTDQLGPRRRTRVLLPLLTPGRHSLVVVHRATDRVRRSVSDPVVVRVTRRG